MIESRVQQLEQVQGIRNVDELEAIVNRAKREEWTHLALMFTEAASVLTDKLHEGWDAERVFWTAFRVETEGARTLARLTSLQELDLYNNNIRDEGACALAVLANL